MQHEPCRLLGDLHGAMNFPTGDPIFAVHNHPHCREPFGEIDWRILKDRLSLERELRRVMLLAAVPAIVFFQEQDVLAVAARALDSIRPASRHKVLAAVLWIGEVNDCFLECGRFHGGILERNRHFIKYIIATVTP